MQDPCLHIKHLRRGPFYRWGSEGQRGLASRTKNSRPQICQLQNPPFSPGTPQGVFITTADQLWPLVPHLGFKCGDAGDRVDLPIRGLRKGFDTSSAAAGRLVFLEQLVPRAHGGCLGEWGSARHALSHTPDHAQTPKNRPCLTPKHSSASALLAFGRGWAFCQECPPSILQAVSLLRGPSQHTAPCITQVPGSPQGCLFQPWEHLVTAPDTLPCNLSAPIKPHPWDGGSVAVIFTQPPSGWHTAGLSQNWVNLRWRVQP